MDLPDDIQAKVDWAVEHLTSEFAGQAEPSRIKQMVEDSVQQLASRSTVLDNVPLLAHRFARERLMAVARTESPRLQGSCDVVFVSLSGGGRGQIAAALTTTLSNGAVSVHSAGTAALSEIDPGVRIVLGEIGVQSDEPFVRPVTDEIIRGADVIVTMGHSVGVIQMPANVRHEDWRVGDPIGAPLDEIRRVRTDIEHRVRMLLASLGVDVPDDSRVTGISA